MPPNQKQALTVERLQQAIDTLRAAAFEPSFAGAIGQPDHQRVLIEAKRNLMALARYLYGDGVTISDE